MSNTEFKLGQILVNSLRQYTKVISFKNGVYGISGWTSRDHAEKATVAHKFVNRFGLKYAEAKAVKGGKSSKDTHADDDKKSPNDTPTKSEINKLKADDARALAEKLGVDAEGTGVEVKDRLLEHFGL